MYKRSTHSYYIPMTKKNKHYKMGNPSKIKIPHNQTSKPSKSSNLRIPTLIPEIKLLISSLFLTLHRPKIIRANMASPQLMKGRRSRFYRFHARKFSLLPWLTVSCLAGRGSGGLSDGSVDSLFLLSTFKTAGALCSRHGSRAFPVFFLTDGPVWLCVTGRNSVFLYLAFCVALILCLELNFRELW